MSSDIISPNTIVFALGKFHPPHSGHINILGAALKSYADRGLTSILFITTKTNKIGDIQVRMDSMRTLPRAKGDGRGAKTGVNSHPPGGYAFTRIPVDSKANFGDLTDPANFKNDTIRVKGQAVPRTQKEIYDRVEAGQHINIETFNDTPLTPHLKRRIMEHALNSRGGNPVRIIEVNGFYAIKDFLNAEPYKVTERNIPLIMLAGSDRMHGKEGYPQKLNDAGLENFRVVKVGTDRPEVDDIHSGKMLRHLAHEASDESKATKTPILDTESGKKFAINTGYKKDKGDVDGERLTLEAIDQIVEHTPRGGKRKSRKRKYNKKRKTKKGKRNRRVKTKRKRNKRKTRSRRRR